MNRGITGFGAAAILALLAFLVSSCNNSNPVKTVDNKADLAALLDYPLTLPFEGTSMSWNEVLTVQKSVPAVRDSVLQQIEEAEEIGDKESLELLYGSEAELGRLQTLADSLVHDDSKKIRCTVRLVEIDLSRAYMEEQGYAPDESGVFEKWQQVRLNNGARLATAQGVNGLGNFAIDEDDFVLSFYLKEGDSKEDVTLDLSQAWSLMHLLHEMEFVRRYSSGRAYDLEIPFSDTQGEQRFFYINLEFEKALPVMQRWPRSGRLNIMNL
jgi:hypothetical protein